MYHDNGPWRIRFPDFEYQTIHDEDLLGYTKSVKFILWGSFEVRESRYSDPRIEYELVYEHQMDRETFFKWRAKLEKHGFGVITTDTKNFKNGKSGFSNSDFEFIKNLMDPYSD